MINIPENKHVNPSLVDKAKNKLRAMFNGMPMGGPPKGEKRKGRCPLGFGRKDKGDAEEKQEMHPHMKRFLEEQEKIKEANSVEEVIAELNEEEKLLMIGQKTSDPLHEAFPRKRVVHPGASGIMLPPPAQQPAWQHYMEFKTEPGNKRAAYIHIPFCSQKCLYCGFFQNAANQDLETIYVDHLLQQFEMAKGFNYIQTGEISAVFFGGGTPSELSPANVTRVLKAMQECLPLAADCEITMESTVHDLTKEKLEAWYNNGVNRISIGVQSFDTQIRTTMGRKDSREVVIENIKRAASYNKGVIIVDLIYGLPYQTVEKFLDDLKTIHELPIDGMDLYQLNIFENSALKQAIDKGTIPPAASTKEQADYLAAAVDYLKDLGYLRLSVCHWAKSNKERSLYNTLAKSNAEVIPFGSGAGGYVKDISLFLHRDLNTYNQLVEEGKWPMMVMLQEPANKALYKELQSQVEHLKIDLVTLSNEFDERVLKLESLLAIWVDYGLIEKVDQGYRLTMAGQFWQNNLTQTMIEMLERLLAGKKSMELQPIAAQG